MFRFAPYVLKTLWRHRTRSLLTLSGAAVALFVFAAVGAVREGLLGLTRDARAGRTLVAFQANRFCPSTSQLPEDYARRIAKLPGVADACPVQVAMNNCRASLDLVVFQGLPADKLRAFRDVRLVAGDWEAFAGRRDAALVGRALARRRGLDVGETFSMGELSVTVAGVFASDTAGAENYAYAHLPFLQRTRGTNAVGRATQVEVKLADGADADAAAQAVDDLFRAGPIATDTRPLGVFQANAVADLAELIGFAAYLGYACVGLVLALVGTTTLMAVQDRVREYAVLQTLGVSGPRVFRLVLAESVLLSVAGGVLGTAAALGGLAMAGLAVGTEGVAIALAPSATLALHGAAVSLAVGMVAGLAPAWQAARAEIVPALRAA